VIAKSPAPTGIIKHSLVIAGHRTSVSLEQVFWSQLKDIAARRNCSVAALVAQIDAGRAHANLSSAIRVFVLQSVVTAGTIEPARSEQS
jgi:predicted DNA-binding ribbon-helix-helix protein